MIWAAMLGKPSIIERLYITDLNFVFNINYSIIFIELSELNLQIKLIKHVQCEKEKTELLSFWSKRELG